MLEWGKGDLDAIGLILGVGEFADGINGVISLGRGDYVSAGLSFASMIPIIGDAVGKGCKKATIDTAKAVMRSSLVPVLETIQDSASEIIEFISNLSEKDLQE